MTARTWKVDPIHTSAEFHVRHMDISTYRGRFTTVGGTVVLDDENPGASSIEARIDARSFAAPAGRFTEVMLGKDFFQADAHLPDGALLTQLRCRLMDNAAGNSLNVNLIQDLVTGGVVVGSVAATAVSPNFVEVSAPLSHVVDNALGGYHLSFVAGSQGNLERVLRCWVSYTETGP